MELDELKERLTAIKHKGYVTSMRRGNTGIGYTLETLLEVRENNLRSPDFGDMELKAHRRGVKSLITLFTFNRGAWKMRQSDVIAKYGYMDTNGRNSLYCLVSSKPNNQGFYTRIEDNGVSLLNVDGEFVAEWRGQTLIERFGDKMPALVFVQADVRENSAGKEEFWFNQAYFLTNPSVDNFLNLIETNQVVVDLRMHLKPNGTVRNHGTGFRIEEQYLSLCFGGKENLI